MNHRSARQRVSNRDQRGGTIINIITAVIFFGLIAAGVLWIIRTAGQAGRQYTTAVIDTQDRATSLTCQMNLRAIGQNLQMYTVSNDRFPADLQELINWTGDSRLLRCPDPNGGPYIYVPGSRPDDSNVGILVYEPTPVHDGKHNVLLTNGQIAALTPEELKAAIEATLAGHDKRRGR